MLDLTALLNETLTTYSSIGLHVVSHQFEVDLSSSGRLRPRELRSAQHIIKITF